MTQKYLVEYILFFLFGFLFLFDLVRDFYVLNINNKHEQVDYEFVGGPNMINAKES